MQEAVLFGAKSTASFFAYHYPSERQRFVFSDRIIPKNNDKTTTFSAIFNPTAIVFSLFVMNATRLTKTNQKPKKHNKTFSQCGDKYPTAVNTPLPLISTPPCPPLILEGELYSVQAARLRWCQRAHPLLRWYPTPPLRLEGGRGALTTVSRGALKSAAGRC